MKIYNKLVRDKIPEIIRDDGAQPITRILSADEYLEALVTKLGEEYEEFKASRTIEEIADIYEVLGAIGTAFGFDADQIESVRQKKASERGGFNDKIFLEGVEESIS